MGKPAHRTSSGAHAKYELKTAVGSICGSTHGAAGDEIPCEQLRLMGISTGLSQLKSQVALLTLQQPWRSALGLRTGTDNLPILNTVTQMDHASAPLDYGKVTRDLVV